MAKEAKINHYVFNKFSKAVLGKGIYGENIQKCFLWREDYSVYRRKIELLVKTSY